MKGAWLFAAALLASAALADVPSPGEENVLPVSGMKFRAFRDMRPQPLPLPAIRAERRSDRAKLYSELEWWRSRQTAGIWGGDGCRVMVGELLLEPPVSDRNLATTGELEKRSLRLLAKESYFHSGLLPSEFLRRLLKRFPEATAIACDGDNVAFEFYWSLKDMGIRVPEDLSLTGFSGFPEVQRLIKLTTVDEHPHRIGFYAAELLVAILEKRVQEPVHELFEVEFINGATTAPPRTAGLPFVPQG